MEKFRFYALWLCVLCIVLFIIQNIFPGFTDALLLNPEAIPEAWRFLSAIFLHGSLPHLLYNIFALALFGSILERFVGGKKFLLVFFLSGLVGNIVAFNFYSSSLGASGAIYGILGALVILQPGMMVWAFGFPMPMFLAAVFWVGAGILGLFIPSNTGYIAHLSGIAIGFMLGVIFRLQRKNLSSKKDYRIQIPEYQIREFEDRFMS